MSIEDLYECAFEHEETIDKAMSCQSKAAARQLLNKLKWFESLNGYNLWMSDESGIPPCCMDDHLNARDRLEDIIKGRLKVK